MKTRKSTVYFFNILAALMLLVIVPSLCLSAVPLRINYQGYLTDSTGGPVDTATEPGGTIQIRFSLHDVLSVGNELWFEEQAVQVIQGVYSVKLGLSTPLPALLDFNSQYYLEIAIDEDASTTFDPGEELTPRQALTSVPYALNADKVDGMDSGDFAASSHNHSGTEINSGIVSEARIDAAIARSADVTSAVNTHAADASVHHAIYTDADAVNSVQTASYITDLQNRIAALEAKLAKVTTDGNNIYITGANLHVRNTSGTTDGADGLGNIIIGWNETRGGGADSRGGSHNLVLGMRNNYSSFGGIVLGHFNTISADHASVTGGETNTASAAFATITGGTGNTASHLGSTVIGGLANSTSSLYDIKP